MVCLSVCLSVCMYVWHCMSIHLFVCLSVSLSLEDDFFLKFEERHVWNLAHINFGLSWLPELVCFLTSWLATSVWSFVHSNCLAVGKLACMNWNYFRTYAVSLYGFGVVLCSRVTMAVQLAKESRQQKQKLKRLKLVYCPDNT